jgi:hypothetical protein
MFQSKLFLDEKNKCTFYPTKDPKVYEPYITSNNTRNNIIYEIINQMADRDIFTKEMNIQNKDKVIVLRFRDGDREFANTLLGINYTKFWSFEDLGRFTDPVKYNLIKTNIDIAKNSDKDESVFLVEFYEPDSDRCFTYTSFARVARSK